MLAHARRYWYAMATTRRRLWTTSLRAASRSPRSRTALPRSRFLLLREPRIAAHLGQEALDLIARRRERAARARRLDGVGLERVADVGLGTDGRPLTGRPREARILDRVVVVALVTDRFIRRRGGRARDVARRDETV